jgi:hypothetical protein
MSDTQRSSSVLYPKSIEGKIQAVKNNWATFLFWIRSEISAAMAVF